MKANFATLIAVIAIGFALGFIPAFTQSVLRYMAGL